MIRSAIPIVNQKREFTFMEIINRAFRIGECDKQNRCGHRFLAALDGPFATLTAAQIYFRFWAMRRPRDNKGANGVGISRPRATVTVG